MKRSGLGRGLDALFSDEVSSSLDGPVCEVPLVDIDPNPHHPVSVLTRTGSESCPNPSPGTACCSRCCWSAAQSGICWWPGTPVARGPHGRTVAGARRGAGTGRRANHRHLPGGEPAAGRPESAGGSRRISPAHDPLFADPGRSGASCGAQPSRSGQRPSVALAARSRQGNDRRRKAVGRSRALPGRSGRSRAAVRAGGEAVEKGLSVRQMEALSRGKKIRETIPESTPGDPAMAEFADMMRRIFGTRVHIHGDLNRGDIVLHYYNRDDLDRIYDLMSSLMGNEEPVSRR